MSQEIQLRQQSPVPDLADPFAAYQPHTQHEPQGLRKIHRLLRNRYKWCILLGSILAAAGIFAGYKVPRPQWKCEAPIQIRFAIQPIIDPSSAGTLQGYEQFVNTQVALLKSTRLVQMAMDDERWRAAAPDRRSIDTEAIMDFKAGLNAVTVGRSEIIYVSFTDPDPEIARVAVDCVLSAYKSIALDAEELNKTTRKRVLAEQVKKLTDDRDGIHRKILELAQDDLRPVYQIKMQELARREGELIEVAVNLAALPPDPAPASDATTRPVQRKPEEMSVDEIAAREPRLEMRIRERDAAQAELERLKVLRVGENHPHWRVAVSNLQQKQQAIEEFVANWVKTARLNPEIARAPVTPNTVASITRAQLLARQEQLRIVINQLKKETADLGQKIQSVDQLNRDEELVTAELNKLRGKLDAIELEGKNDPRITVAEKAEKALIAKDNRIQMAGAGGVGGLLMGFAIVLAITIADRRLRRPDDMRSAHRKLALLGVLPSLPDDLSDPEQAAVAAHCVHQIRTLLQIGSGPEHCTFAVTSPAAGTGKTSLTLSLGVSFAASSCRTLIVDCDLIGGGLTARVDAIIRRKIGQIFTREGLVTQQQLDTALRLAHNSHKKLGEILVELNYLTEADVQRALAAQEQMPVGLLDALGGEPLENCVADTGIENLWILPLGAARPGDISKLSVASLRTLLKLARERFDTIVMDTGPVPGSLEASGAAAAADGVVLVVSRGEHRPMAERSIQHLDEIGARVVGLVFNRAQHRDLDLSHTTTTRVSSIGRSMRSVPTRESTRFGPVAMAVTRTDDDVAP